MTPLTPRVKRLLAKDDQFAVRVGSQFSIDVYPAEHSPTIIKSVLHGCRSERARTSQLEEALCDLVGVSERLLERIDHNGGIGEYKGGPAFVVEPLRATLKRLADACAGMEGKNER